MQLDYSKLAHYHLVVVELVYQLLCRLVRPQGWCKLEFRLTVVEAVLLVELER